MTVKTNFTNFISKKSFSLLFLSFFAFSNLSAQQNHYYYYGDQAKTLELNTEYYYLALDAEISDADQLSAALGMEMEVLHLTADHSPQTLKPIGRSAPDQTTFWAEVKLRSRRSAGDYLDFSKTLKSRDYIQWCSPFFKTPNGEKVGVSQYFYVKLKQEKDLEILKRQCKKNAAILVGQNKFMPLWYTLKCAPGALQTTLEMANTFYESGLFTHSEPALIVDDIAMTANDPLYPDQWALNNTGQSGGIPGIDVNACRAWEITQGSRDILVAVLDNGFSGTHPDLRGNVIGPGYNTTTGSSPGVIFGNHGTPCAGIVGAIKDNNTGVSGMAPSLKLMNISDPLFGFGQQRLANGINWAWMNGADIISNSWGSNQLAGSIIDNAISNAFNNGRGGLGTIVVFSAGNSNNNVLYPASSNPDIIAVGAMSPCAERKSPTSCDGELWGSCFGPPLDVVAPGVLISTTDRQGAPGYSPTDYTDVFNGTSSACPAVSGIAGLVLSINPCFTHDEVEDIIEQSAQKVGNYNYVTTAGRPNGTWFPEMGYGLVDAELAVLLAQAQLPTGSNFDLLVRDRPFDAGIEPNPDTGPMYLSEDIWVRQYLDGGLTHQNPEYKMFSPNAIYVRVRNKGAERSPCANLALYFSKNSAGFVWPTHWNNFNINGVKYGDRINTVSIPPIAPGATHIVEVPWFPPNPADFTSDIHRFSILARIISPSDPMFNEQSGIAITANVKNNNNVAWKSVNVFDSQAGNWAPSDSDVFLSREKAAPLPSFSAYPNPANNHLYIDYEIRAKPMSVKIRLHNLSGYTIKQYELDEASLPGKYTAHFEVADLSPGIYFVQVLNGESVQTQKIVIGQ